MSIRINGQADVNSVDTPRAVGPKSADAQTKSAGYVATANESGDEAHLSNSVNLVALAKAVPQPGRAEKLSSLTSRVASGQYKPSSGEISRSIVKSLFKK